MIGPHSADRICLTLGGASAAIRSRPANALLVAGTKVRQHQSSTRTNPFYRNVFQSPVLITTVGLDWLDHGPLIGNHHPHGPWSTTRPHLRRAQQVEHAARGRLEQREELQLGRESTRPELFVVGTGQDDNVGDVVLRREYFDRLRRLGRLHIYMGIASADFLDGLRLCDSDVVYTSFRQWHNAAWRALFRGEVWFIDKPGQLLLDSQTLRRNLKLLPLVIGIRIRKGQVLRLGLAIRALDSKYLRYLRPLFRLSTLIRWRDTSTSSAFRLGAISPDWAFGWDKTRQDALAVDRTDIVVTYRGDREPPAERVLEALSTLTRNGSRRVVVVSQVRRDAERSNYLAHRLNAELVPWPAGRSLADHEKALREVYAKSAIVISDRLHALIVGMTEGAVPLCITDTGEPKVERHLDAAGFDRSTVRIDTASQPLCELIEDQIGRRAEAHAATRAALDCLDDLTTALATLASTGRPGGHVH